jgi:hypothetical protein
VMSVRFSCRQCFHALLRITSERKARAQGRQCGRHAGFIIRKIIPFL